MRVSLRHFEEVFDDRILHHGMRLVRTNRVSEQGRGEERTFDVAGAQVRVGRRGDELRLHCSAHSRLPCSHVAAALIYLSGAADLPIRRKRAPADAPASYNALKRKTRLLLHDDDGISLLAEIKKIAKRDERIRSLLALYNSCQEGPDKNAVSTRRAIVDQLRSDLSREPEFDTAFLFTAATDAVRSDRALVSGGFVDLLKLIVPLLPLPMLSALDTTLGGRRYRKPFTEEFNQLAVMKRYLLLFKGEEKQVTCSEDAVAYAAFLCARGKESAAMRFLQNTLSGSLPSLALARFAAMLSRSLGSLPRETWFLEWLFLHSPYIIEGDYRRYCEMAGTSRRKKLLAELRVSDQHLQKLLLCLAVENDGDRVAEALRRAACSFSFTHHLAMVLKQLSNDFLVEYARRAARHLETASPELRAVTRQKIRELTSACNESEKKLLTFALAGVGMSVLEQEDGL